MLEATLNWIISILREYRFYILTSVFLVIVCICTVPFETVLTPHARKFRLDNKWIQYPYVAQEHVPASTLFLLAAVLPMVVIGYKAFYSAQHRRGTAISMLGLFASLVITWNIIDVAKIFIGNQRPDFIARCIPKPDTPTDKLVRVVDVCTNKDFRKLWEGCKSTPSGHSSLSFAGLGFLAIHLHFALKPAHPDSRQNKYLHFIPLIPLVIAMLIALSRIIDHKHHWIDIISGGIIGSSVACLSYKYIVGISARPDNNTREAYAPV